MICLQDLYTCTQNFLLYDSRLVWHAFLFDKMIFASQCEWNNYIPYSNYFGAYAFRWYLIIGSNIKHQRSLGAHYNLQCSCTLWALADFEHWLDALLDASVSDTGSMSLPRIKPSTLIRNEIKLITINTLKYLWKWVTAISQLYTNEENQRLSSERNPHSNNLRGNLF